jgi:hypothetical protein
MKVRRVLAFIALAGCHDESKSAPPPPPSPSTTPANQDGTYRVVGLEKLARKPIALLVEVTAWDGAIEDLPRVTVYEDGTVITCRWSDGQAEIIEGTTRDAAGLAKKITGDLENVAPRLTVSNATDQPETTIYARRGDVWRSVKVVGFHTSPSSLTPVGFVAAYDKLMTLPVEGAHELARTDYVVTLNDDSVPSHEAADWPADVPPPPANLRPDERWLGRPRTYDLHGSAGASLRALSWKQHAYGVRTPSGERVSLHVVVAIPSSEWIEKLQRCTPWEVQPFHDCDERVPGR